MLERTLLGPYSKALCSRSSAKTLWPEYLALSEELDAHLNELTTRVIREAIDEDVSEATESLPEALPEASEREGNETR